MSDNDINNSIINFINNNYANESNNINSIIESEINYVINNINNNSCSFEYKTINKLTILGISTNINKSIINLTYLIPNLFRKCYLQENIKIPNICPNYTDDIIILNYFPYLLEEDLIKSFLYFNFPASYINSSNIFNNINIIKNLENLVKKRIKNSGQTIKPNQIIGSLYAPNSMLLQLLNFQKYLDKSNYSINNTKIINSFNIKWDITIACVSLTNNINDTYFIMNNTANPNDIYSIIDPYTANNIYDIKLSYVNNFINNELINDNNIVILYYQNIYTLLNYVLDVYNDVLLEIQSYQDGTTYCKKPYMNNTNIPILLKLYNIFYKNQLKSVQMKLPSQSVESVVPTTISIQSYVQSFINIMNATYGTTITYLKNVILSDKDAFVFYFNGNIDQSNLLAINYNFFYININNPSAVSLSNYIETNAHEIFFAFNPPGSTDYYPVSYLVILFNNGFTSWPGYISLNNVSYTTFIEYPYSGLYINGGIVLSTSCTGYLYSYWDSNSKLISKVFLTYYDLKLDGISRAFPVGLEIYHI